MRFWRALQTAATQFLMGCGAFIVGHILFKLIIGRAYEIELLPWFALSLGVYAMVSGVLFLSRRALTPRQFRKRVVIHVILTLLVVAYVYGTDVFQFSLAENPMREMLISCGIFLIMYAATIIIIIRMQQDMACSREMNAALERYRGRFITLPRNTPENDSELVK